MLKSYSSTRFLLLMPALIIAATFSGLSLYFTADPAVEKPLYKFPLVAQHLPTGFKLARNETSALRSIADGRWKDGLDAYRNGDMNTAAVNFTAVLNENVELSASDRATVAFWAYRALNAMGDTLDASQYLAFAADENQGFYSTIARHIAGKETVNKDIEQDALEDAASKNTFANLYPMPKWKPASGYKVERALLFAIMRQESEFKTNVQSSRGALGVMQLMPATAHAMAQNIKVSGSVKDPSVSMALGQQYIQHLMDQEGIGNNIVFLLSAYNAGPATLDKWKSTIAYNNDPLLFIESIPFGSTRNYVVSVIGNYWVYSELFGHSDTSLHMISQGSWPLYAATPKALASAGN